MTGFTNREDLRLTDITIPASHDAGVSEADDCHIGYNALSARKNYIAQQYNIAGQLAAGSRFFDLRIARKSGKLRAFHGEGVLGNLGGGWGQSAASIFEQVDTFLQNHTGEIVILRISHTKASDMVYRAVIGKIHPSRLYRHAGVNIAEVKLPDLRGKAIAIYDAGSLATVFPQNGNHRFEKYTENGGCNGLVICGKYAGQSAGQRHMVQKAISCGNEHGTHSKKGGVKHDHLFMVYWQLAMDIKKKTLKGADSPDDDLSTIVDNKGTHFNLDYLLNLHRGKPVQHVSHRSILKLQIKSTNVAAFAVYKHRPNIINLDFINVDICNKVIAFNHDLLPPVPPPRFH
jgi:hypothetical protein